MLPRLNFHTWLHCFEIQNRQKKTPKQTKTPTKPNHQAQNPILSSKRQKSLLTKTCQHFYHTNLFKRSYNLLWQYKNARFSVRSSAECSKSSFSSLPGLPSHQKVSVPTHKALIWLVPTFILRIWNYHHLIPSIFQILTKVWAQIHMKWHQSLAHRDYCDLQRERLVLRGVFHGKDRVKVQNTEAIWCHFTWSWTDYTHGIKSGYHASQMKCHAENKIQGLQGLCFSQ